MESFTTPRLSAEKLHESHLADLVELHTDHEVSRYLGGVRSPEATKTYLATNIEHWDRHGFGLWIVRTRSGAFAGRAGIRHMVVEGVDEVEVAYAFTRAAWGQGFASEISAALVDIGLSQLKLPSLVGLVAVEHVASRRVLEKSGLVPERNAIFRGTEIVVYRSPAAARR
jgi:RimJ/RimL family protein N-acetyltransferase